MDSSRIKLAAKVNGNNMVSDPTGNKPLWLPSDLMSTTIASTHADIHFELIKQRWIKRTLREVYIGADKLVVKRFLQYPGIKDYRKPWIREHRALTRLKGLQVPTSYGYHYSRTSEGIPVVIFTRSYIKGKSLSKIDETIQTKAAELLGQFHRRGVVTLDPALPNFVQAENGGLYFLDFGRARTYRFKSVWFYFLIGKELLRLFREAFFHDMDQYRRFEKIYFSRCRELRGWRRTVILRSFTYWKWRYQRKSDQAA